MNGQTTLSLGRTGYDVCHSPLYFVNENVHLIMSPRFLTHKHFTVKLNLVKIVFIGGLENRITGIFLIKNFGTMSYMGNSQ